MFHLSCSPWRAFILHRPHLSICALGVCLSLCGEQGQGILLTCDSDSTLNQGQRAGGKRKKGLHKFPSHLICDFERLRTGEQLIIHEEWILAPVDAFNVFVQVLRFKTTTLIQPPSHYRQNCAVKPEDQERNSNLISSGIFTVKMRLLQHPHPLVTLSSPLKSNKSVSKSSQTLDSLALLPWRPLQYQVPLLLVNNTFHYGPPNQIKAGLPWNNQRPKPAVIVY